MASPLTRILARFIQELSWSALPEDVRDRVKGRVLHGLGAAMAGFRTPFVEKGLHLVRSVRAEGNATVLGDGAKVDPLGAAFVNALAFSIRNMHDSYRIVMHPSTSVVPAALAASEVAQASGRAFAEGVAAGLEVATRLARDYVWEAQDRSFRASSIFNVFGAAAAASKALGLTEDQTVNAIGTAATLASGTSEAQRLGGEEGGTQEAFAAQNGLYAAFLAQSGFQSPESALDGESGFYAAFLGKTRLDTPSIVENLGERWELMHICSKWIPAIGFNQLPTLLMVDLIKEHRFTAEDVASVAVEMSRHELIYPSYVVPRRLSIIGAPEYFIATACVLGDFPRILPLGQFRPTALAHAPQETSADLATSGRILETMKRVFVTYSAERDVYSPRMTVRLKDGRVLSGEMSPKALQWGPAKEKEVLAPLLPIMGVSAAQWEALTETVEHLETLDSTRRLLSLTVPGAKG
ncbi:MAG: MmgE/PrpD family protein [Chloroflexi bacterium]|nr:MmgE/PrpD family protein [Chloroflexota bacterium]